MQQISEEQQVMGWDCLCAPEFLHKMTVVKCVLEQVRGSRRSWGSFSSARGLGTISLEQTQFHPSVFPNPSHDSCTEKTCRFWAFLNLVKSEKFFQIESQVCTWQRSRTEAEMMRFNARPGRADVDLAQHPLTALVLDWEVCVLFVKRYNKGKLLS